MGRSQRHLRTIRGVDSGGNTPLSRGEPNRITAAIPTGAAPYATTVARSHAIELGPWGHAWATLAKAGVDEGTAVKVGQPDKVVSRTPASTGVYALRLYRDQAKTQLLAQSANFTVV